MKDKPDKVTPDFPDMEGDFFYHDGLEYKVDKEEGHIHQTVRAFEELMATHGLNNLLEYMSIQGQAQFWTEIDDLDGGYE